MGPLQVLNEIKTPDASFVFGHLQGFIYNDPLGAYRSAGIRVKFGSLVINSGPSTLIAIVLAKSSKDTRSRSPTFTSNVKVNLSDQVEVYTTYKLGIIAKI